jgi:sulfur-carrier protein
MKISVPNPLRSHTRGQAVITGCGATLEAVLNDLDRQFPGLRFRVVNERNAIREHIKIFADDCQLLDLNAPLADADRIYIVCALSGGTGDSGAAGEVVKNHSRRE